MGYPMAGHLARAGLHVTVYNRTAEKARRWIDEYGGAAAATPEEAVIGADMVFACVGNDDDIRAVASGEQGAFKAMKPGAVFVDHSTVSATVARELSVLAAERELEFIDAPVSGGQQGAEQGVLTVMCGAQPAVFDRVKPVVEHYARSVQLLGPVGSGQLCKMVNQICIAGLLQGLSEGLHFAQQVGLDAHQVVETISKGAAQSWQMDNRYKTMLAGEYDHGFAVDWMRKDLAIALQEAAAHNVPLTVTELVDRFYADIQASGGGRWDTSSLLARLQKQGKDARH
jgi:3-hydroxyisobutyrate dehydrogenase-like beta-hydroxyacid dehydrogenase